VKRGDIVTVASGKPRPVVVVQSDYLLPYPMVIVVPFTSEIDARPPPFTRVTIDPSPVNGLRRVSQLMIDRSHRPARGDASIDGRTARGRPDDRDHEAARALARHRVTLTPGVGVERAPNLTQPPFPSA